MSFPRFTAIVSATRCLCIVCKNLFSQSKKQNLLNFYEEFFTTVAFLSVYIKYLFLIIFIGTRAFEYNILSTFVLF